MANYYSDKQKVYVAVDCIIFGFDNENLKLLLIKRDFEPGKDQWSLMGGFLHEDESLDHSAQRILKKLTGLGNIFLEQLYTYGETHRDPGARVLSVAYYALIRTEDYDETLGDKYGAKWFKISKVPQLVFDHNELADKALRRLKRKSRTEPIGFNLLPEKFTIPQMQSLYEAINQEKLDKRNFRRKILSMNLLTKLEEKERENSRKGAYLFRFDKKKYDELVGEGFSFEL
jgi:8-oxo-dGTP diphosphatase